MSRFVHNMTLVAVLLHLHGGCCWHHAHAEDWGRDCEAADIGSCACGCPHQHDEREPSPEGDTDHHSSGCDGEHCVFVVPDTGDSPDLCFRTGFLDITVPAHPAWRALLTAASRRADGLPPPVGPPLRQHLLMEVLLL